ncbi:MAG: RNA-binding S4 domain-containing protein [Alicyclobacillus sp.]|nr:RNA-binding S4 domain-containing protein [Alicyclobacillus sp.]
MRLDKFLKVSRLIKRRTVAKEICDAGRIAVNGRVAKAGTELKVGDVLTIRYGPRTVEVRIEQLVDNPRKEAAPTLYTVLSDTLNASSATDPGTPPAGVELDD